jgi:hypothetical protein
MSRFSLSRSELILIRNFSSLHDAQTIGDQRQTVGTIKDELMSTFKALLTETQKGLEQVLNFIFNFILFFC